MAFKHWAGSRRPVHAQQATAQVTLAPDIDAPASARRAIGALANGYHADSVADAQLLVTELVTNAVRHGSGGAIHIELWLEEGALDVVVSDGGPGFTPHARAETDDPADGGLGLEVVDIFAERWGSSSDRPGSVWFRLPMPEGIAEHAPAGLLDVRRLIDSVTHHAVVAVTPDGEVSAWSAAAERLTGYSGEEFLGGRLSELFEPSRALERGLEDAAAGRDTELHSWLRRSDGSVVWVAAALAPIRDGADSLRGFSVVLSDQTAQKRHDEERERLIANLRDLSLTDELTKLPNRRGWLHSVERELVRARREGKTLAVAMLDLNGFKAFNDSHGHLGGDTLLRELARAWSEPLRATDVLARYGGDEFALVLPHCDAAEAVTVVGRIQDATPPGVDSAAGIVTTDGSESPDAVIQRADAALYEAKRRGERAVLASTVD